MGLTERMADDKNRKQAFTGRKDTLIKKADELAIVCDAEVAVIIFDESGKLHEFCNTDMPEILARYKTHVEKEKGPAGSSLLAPERAGTEENQAIKKLLLENEALRKQVASHASTSNVQPADDLDLTLSLDYGKDVKRKRD